MGVAFENLKKKHASGTTKVAIVPLLKLNNNFSLEM